ncbi:MAG: ABC transporter substrate-binding protein [Gemmatimonadota bacterium]|nr:ABC transporter substrate-binding protein [Gemmatimonadota bacterium]
MFSLTRGWLILPIAAGMAWGCGGERLTTSSDPPTEEYAGKPLSKLAVDGNVTSSVAIVRLRQDQSPVNSAVVAFSRSVSGRGASYEWAGTTDGRGQARVALEGTQTGGYYRAQARREGVLIGSWSSIPINGGFQVTVELPVGEKARVTGATVLTPGGLPAEIPIGVVAPLTVRQTQYGAGIESGLALALDEINGTTMLGGASIVFRTEDSRGMAQGAVDAFNKLIFHDYVPVILGPALSTEAREAFPVAQRNQVVAFSTTSAASGLSAIGDFIFRASLSVDVLIPGGVSLTREKLRFGRVALMVDSTDVFSRSSDDALQSALSEEGVEIMTRETFGTDDTSFVAQLARIRDLNPHAVFVSALSRQRVQSLVQGRREGIPGNIPFIVPGLTQDEIRDAGDAAEGAIAITGWTAAATTPGNQAFVENYRSKFGGAPNRWAAQSYAALYVLSEAIAKAGSTDPPAIRDAMAGIANLDTVLGRFSFDRNGDAVYDPIVLVVRNGRFEVYE